LRSRTLQEIHANISFAILIAVVSIVLMLVSFFRIDNICEIMTIPVYFLTGVFLFTLLMVLKRIHLLVKHDLGTSDRAS